MACLEITGAEWEVRFVKLIWLIIRNPTVEQKGGGGAAYNMWHLLYHAWALVRIKWNRTAGLQSQLQNTGRAAAGGMLWGGRKDTMRGFFFFSDTSRATYRTESFALIHCRLDSIGFSNAGKSNASFKTNCFLSDLLSFSLMCRGFTPSCTDRVQAALRIQSNSTTKKEKSKRVGAQASTSPLIMSDSDDYLCHTQCMSL